MRQTNNEYGMVKYVKKYRQVHSLGGLYGTGMDTCAWCSLNLYQELRELALYGYKRV